MTYLFDTNIVSELRRPELANSGVVSWTSAISRGEVFVSTITLHELERGVLKAERKDASKGRALRRWMSLHVRPTYEVQALPVTTEIALRAAPFVRLPTADLADHLIAATALVHDLTLVTRNIKHFAHTGVRLLNPFT